MLHERPDQSGRDVLNLTTRFMVTADNTPVYDRFFAGGFSTIRGFGFRGVSPVEFRPPPNETEYAHVGGDAMFLASAEFLFPLTADDMLRGVVFCDTGTVEPTINKWNASYRVAPGSDFGSRSRCWARCELPRISPFPSSRIPPTVRRSSVSLGFMR